MSTLVVGLSHHSAPITLLEAAALDRSAQTKLLADVIGSEHAFESMVLSTCNRVEVYAEVDKFHGGVAEVSELLARHADVPLESLTPHLYVHYEDRAVAHLFSVVCGLDSMVVGESQIVSQVRQALQLSQVSGTSGRMLAALTQQALRVGKRARTETGIDRAGRSLVTAGVEQAIRLLGPLTGRSVLVLGAGSMAALAASVLTRAGVQAPLVASRTLSHAQRLAETMHGSAVPIGALGAVLPGVDLLVSCTGAIGHVVDATMVASAMRDRAARPLVVIDLALPRDVDPAAREIDAVTVVDLETLADVLTDGEHVADVNATRDIVAEETAAFLGWQRAVNVAPTVVALRGMAEDVVVAELTRLAGRVPELDERSRGEIETTVRRVVDKLLHVPTVRVKQLAEEPGGHSYADALSRLFDLDQRSVEAVTAPEVPAPADDGPGADSGGSQR